MRFFHTKIAFKKFQNIFLDVFTVLCVFLAVLEEIKLNISLTDGTEPSL